MAKYWMGTPPEKCDICSKKITNEFYDAKTKSGIWGCLCKKCFKTYGTGLGTGFGQYYERDLLKEGKTFVKKAG